MNPGARGSRARYCVEARTPYARQLSYSRLVRVGHEAWVSGCLPIDSTGALIGADSAYAQAHSCLAHIANALAAAEMNLGDVVRTRIYLRSFSVFDDVARAHCEAFPLDPPACTVITVPEFSSPQILVYMDADARGNGR